MARTLRVVVVVTYLVRLVDGSPGDRAPGYRRCMDGCVSLDGWEPSASLWLLGWTQEADCSYRCMWSHAHARAASGESTLQYHGKWPFARVGGVQEPASVVLSLANGAAHAAGLRRCAVAGELGADRLRGALWSAAGAASIVAWACAAVFHCRDVYWTQCADYFSALVVLVVGCVVAASHLVEALVGQACPSLVLALSAAGLAGVLAHVRGMLRFFDYGMHVTRCVGLGAAQMLLWTAWWRAARRRRPHAWRVAALSLALNASCALELTDFPALGGVLDAHALWHASTVPLSHLLWRSFVGPELRWVARDVREARDT